MIEHIPVENIHRFTAELQRVAMAGYIEAPSILYEAVRDIREHIWYVVCDSGIVHICRKRSVSGWQPFIDPLFYDLDFCSVVEKYADLFFTGMEWQDSLKVEIHEDVADLVALYPPGWAKKIVIEGIERAKHEEPLALRKNLINMFFLLF